MSASHVDRRVRDWIRAATGIHITDDNVAPVELAVRLDAERRGLSPSDLLAGVLSGRLAAQPLIDAIATNESYFFRAEKQMALCTDALLPQRLQQQGRPQRVLSLPCARGEEPYSLAMLLRERGIADASVAIVGADISDACLAAARQGLYGAAALRRTGETRVQRWFRAEGPGRHRLDPSILARVRLHRANLLSPEITVLDGPFDIVFCQNLLIYFDRPTIDRALAALARLLRPDGWLFVDHTEWNLPRERFRMWERSGCIGFRPFSALPPAGASDGRGRAPRTGPRPPAAGAPAREPTPLQHGHPLGQRTGPPSPGVARRSTATGSVGASSTRAAGLSRPASRPAQAQSAAQGPEAQLRAARALADAGEEIEALERLETLLAALDEGRLHTSTSNRAEALALFGLLLRRKGLTALAQGYLDEVARLAPDHPVLRLRGDRDG